jgi:hypothetical protein
MLCLLATACARSGSTSSRSDPSPAADAVVNEGDRSIESAVDALVDEFGTEGAFAVGVFALERGYLLDQIIDGALIGAATRAGSIEGVEPAGQSLGLIEINPDSVLFTTIQPLPAEEFLQVEVLREVAAQTVIDEGLVDVGANDLVGATILVLILGFLDQGWSPQDVIGAIIAGVHPADFNPADVNQTASQDLPAAGAEDSSTNDDQAPSTVLLSGTARLSTTDVGNAKTCLADLEVQAAISPDGQAEMTYIRTIAAGVPPGGLGTGDVSQYVECIPADRPQRHNGSFDVLSGIVQLDDVGELQVDVSDDGLATMQGTISATDFLNNWTLEADLVECSTNC